jgi:hypothetical protein
MPRFIRYIGLSHKRMITAQDWQSVGIRADTVVWAAQNGFSVPLDALTEDQIRKAIDNDRDFVITGDDEEFVPQAQTVDMVPAALEQANENPVDVPAYVEGRSDVSTDDSGASGAPGGDAPTTTTTSGGSSRTSKTNRES